MKRGQLVKYAGETVLVIDAFPYGTSEHRQPWVKLMRGLGKEQGYGCEFFCRDMIELEYA